jgi:predicted CXXCH cytochrome family protein
VLALGALVILVGCSTQTRYKWLSTFFDGVPEPGSTNHPPHTGTAPGPLETVNPVPPQATTAATPAPVKFYSHPPFENHQCTECHRSRFDVKMKGTQKEVCFACHDDFLAKAKFKHQPVDGSQCTACHEPHGSTNKYMVKLVGRALCLDCHDDPGEKPKFKHQPVQSNCEECHKPHASDNKGLVTKPGKALCFDCHDDFLEKAKFKHAAADTCSDCHKVHGSNEKGMLSKPLATLCMDCHEQKDIDAVKGHQGMGTTSCMKCHDPHVGTDKNLIKPGAPKAGESENTAPK